MNKLILVACGLALLLFACDDEPKGQSNADSPQPKGNDNDSGDLHGGNRNRVSRSVPPPKSHEPTVKEPEPKTEPDPAPKPETKPEPKAD